VSKETHIVLCTTCWKFELRDPDPKKCGDGLRRHYEEVHPKKAQERGWTAVEGVVSEPG
jgi:hypothetical protein